MEQIRQYILSVITVTVICSIVKKITGTKFSAIIHVICGLYLAVTVISPIIKYDYRSLDLTFDDHYADAKVILDESNHNVQQSMSSIIKEQTQSYILNKATALGMDIQVDVILDENEYVPIMVHIQGDGSPYQRSMLAVYMEDTLAIPEASQIWI